MNAERRGSCLYAFALLLIFGGRIRVRRSSHFRLLPHFGCELDGKVWSFEPVRPRDGWRVLLDVVFVGRWRVLSIDDFYEGR